jgi:hypothetical protein
MENKYYTGKDINGKGLDYIGNSLYKHNVSGNLYKETSNGFKLFKPSKFKWIKLGSWLEFLIEIFTLGKGEAIALWIAKKVFKKDSCGCCQRKEWLNKLTNPQYDGECNGIKLY